MVKEPDYSQVQSPKWETYKLKDVFSFLQNNTLSRENLNDTGGHLQNIHYGDILVKYGNIVDCSMCAIPFINDNISAKIKSSLLQDGDVIMADTAEDETVGKTCEILGIGDCAVVSGLHTFPMRPKKGLFKKGFLGYYFNSKDYHNQIIPYITGIKVSSISRSSVKETLVLCPSPPEQQAIAEALSDIDRLIASTEKLIAKKKAIKQGLMQELLTGKRRLPGFSEKWETISLDKILSFETTTIPATLFSPSRYIATENMISGGGILPNELTIPYTKVRAYQEKDILISNIRPYLRKIWFSDTIGGCSNDVLVLRAKKNFSALFVFYSLCRDSFFDFMMEHARGTKMPRGDKEALKTYKINVPKDPKEQEKIANMLEACQAEISGRSAELQKFKQIKQGMMSELLTGRIRLPFVEKRRKSNEEYSN